MYNISFTMDELTGSVITVYIMWLYERIKNGGNVAHGICFVNPSSIFLAGCTDSFITSNEGSRNIADRLCRRSKEEHIILLPFRFSLGSLGARTRIRTKR